MDDPPYLRLVYDKSARTRTAPESPKRRRRRGRAKACCSDVASDPTREALELTELRRRLSELERECRRDNHVICVAVFVTACAYWGFILWQRMAA